MVVVLIRISDCFTTIIISFYFRFISRDYGPVCALGALLALVSIVLIQ